MEMDFNKVCRTCMCEGGNMFPLFPEDPEAPNFPDMLMSITSVKVAESDGLPCQLCTQCASSLDVAVNFKNLCEKSDSLFRQYMSERLNTYSSSKPVIKQEPPAEYEQQYESHDDSNHDYDDNYVCKTEPKIELKEEKPTIQTPPETKSKPSKKYSCNICGKAYSGPKSLKRHTAVHRGEGHNCNQCPKAFSRRDHLRKHLQRVHSVNDIEAVMNSISAKPVVKYDCQYCGVDASSKALMAKHMRACHRDKLPKRKNSAFNNNHELDSDADEEEPKDNEEEEEDDGRTVGQVTSGGAVATIREHRTNDSDESRLVLEVKYRCTTCGARYDNQHSYAAHMTKHADPLPKGQTQFNCTMCDKVFSKRRNLRQHALTHSKEKANKCTMCSRAFTRPDQLILHMNNHTGNKRHQCPHCDKGFNMASTLKDHLRTHSGERPYLCSICGKGFTQGTNLKQHLMRHSSTKPFPCPMCHSRFVSKGELDSHLRKHTGDHPFACDTCGTGFTTSSSLVKHKRIHSGERPYACDLCPQSFAALGTLKNHRRTHTGEKPYACTYCTRAFVQKSDMVSHIRTHTGECPYVCSVCGSRYQKSSALKAHIKVHHPHLDPKMPVTAMSEAHLSQLSTHSSERELTVSYNPTPESSQSPHFVHSDQPEHKAYNMA